MKIENIFVAALVFIITSCSIIRSSNNNDPNCTEVTPIPTPTMNSNYKYYIILVDGSEEWKSFRDQGVDVILKVLSEVLKPGDKIAAIWMDVGNLGGDKALFFSTEVEKFPLPELVEEPSPVYIPTPTALVGGETVASRKQHNNEVEEVKQKNEQILKTHNCQHVFPIRKDNNNKIEDWEQLNKKEITRVVDEFSKSVNTLKPDYYKSVFEALKLSSDIFKEVCTGETYRDCQLIIISNMIDWRSNLKDPETIRSIQNMNIDFSNVSVSIIWTDCNFYNDEFQSKCGSRKETWEEYFKTFNATEDKGNLIFVNLNNAVDRLEKFIGE